MKNLILKILFERYKVIFEDMMVKELIAKTPTDSEEPAMNFLSNGKEKLEKWLLFQSYHLQKRSASDPKSSAIYNGGLLYIAVFLKLVNQNKKEVKVISQIKEEESVFAKLDNVFDGLRKYKKPVKK